MSQIKEEVIVAATALQLIGRLHDKLLSGAQHDAASLKMLQGTTAYLAGILDGKSDALALAGNLDEACQALSQAVLDEMDRCQHMLADQVEKSKLAESRALLAEQQSKWYERLRDGMAGGLIVTTDGMGSTEFEGADLDAYMEDLDDEDAEEKAANNAE